MQSAATASPPLSFVYCKARTPMLHVRMSCVMAAMDSAARLPPMSRTSSVATCVAIGSKWPRVQGAECCLAAAVGAGLQPGLPGAQGRPRDHRRHPALSGHRRGWSPHSPSQLTGQRGCELGPDPSLLRSAEAAHTRVGDAQIQVCLHACAARGSVQFYWGVQRQAAPRRAHQAWHSSRHKQMRRGRS